jgi:hypothetical protein
MKRRDDFDERAFRPRVGETLDSFFGGVCVEPSKAPATIHTPAPVAPGSATSEEAAKLVSVDGECLRCLQWYAGQTGPRTRYDLALAVYPADPDNPNPRKRRRVAGTGPACGRTNDLMELGYLEEVGRDGRSATLAVTERGRVWLAKRRAAA